MSNELNVIADTNITIAINQRNASRKEITLLDGRVVSTCIGETLNIHDNDGRHCPIYFEFLDENNELHESFYKCFIATLATHHLSSNSTISRALKAWLSLVEMKNCYTVGLTEITLLMKIPDSYRRYLLPLLRRIKALSLPGLSEAAIDFLESGYKWEQKGNGVYYTLITNDPERGALTDQELNNIHISLNKGYSERIVSLRAYALCWFFIGTGVRPIQVKRMTMGDVIVHDRHGMDVTLRVPLAKGQGTVAKEYWIRKAPTVLAECLITYLDVYKHAQTTSETPLFQGSSTALGHLVTSTLAALPTYSDRLEGPVHITPYRFRYTLATRALAQGASDAEVARLLTHRSTSCIQFYRASMPQLQKPIRKALGKEMDYFASAFQGRLIEHMDEATRAGDDECVIADYLRLTGETLGACGTRAECHQHAPIACLSCSYFEPLINAPWETLMVALIEDQKIEPEPRIQQINQNAMSAIQQIIAIRDSRVDGVEV